jgi:uncharacterized protein
MYCSGKSGKPCPVGEKLHFYAKLEYDCNTAKDKKKISRGLQVMKTIDKIKNTIHENKNYLSDKFKVKSISVFGSYLRGEQKKDSDLDILVEFNETIDLFQFIKLENYLAEILGCKVDLVMKDALKPRIKDRILREAVSI